jgi:hypothetical protein
MKSVMCMLQRKLVYMSLPRASTQAVNIGATVLRLPGSSLKVRSGTYGRRVMSAQHRSDLSAFNNSST